MKKAIYPGSFDPITKGHLDIIERSAAAFDEITVVIMNNGLKKYTFTVEERLTMIQDALKELPGRFKIDYYDGLLIDYLKENDIQIVIRGLRALTDFNYEFQMSLTNRQLYPKCESVLFVTKNEYSYISSSIVKEVSMYHGDVSSMVPPNVKEALDAKYAGGR